MLETYDNGGARKMNAADVSATIEMNSICGIRSIVMNKIVPDRNHQNFRSNAHELAELATHRLYQLHRELHVQSFHCESWFSDRSIPRWIRWRY